MRRRFPAYGGTALALLALSAAVLLAVAATAAVSAPDKHVPHRHALSPRGQDIESYKPAGNPRGDALVAWTAYTPNGRAEVWVRYRKHGRRFGQPRALSNVRVTGVAPTTALGADGTAVVAWIETGDKRPRLVAVTRPPGGPFGKRTVVTRGLDEEGDPGLAIAPDGTTMVAWARRHHGVRQLHAALRRPGGGWSQLGRFTNGKRSAGDPLVELDAAGDAILAWARVPGPGYESDFFFGPSRSQVAATVRPAGGPFARPHVVSNRKHDASNPSLAVNERGDAALVWGSMELPERFRVGFTSRRAGQGFARARWLTPQRSLGTFPQAAIDATGGVIAMWTQGARSRHGRLCDECSTVHMARGRAGGRLSHAGRVSGRRGNLRSLSGDAVGSALAVWEIGQGRHSLRDRVEARVVSPSGKLGPRVWLSPASHHLDVQSLLPDNGDGLVTWMVSRRWHNRLVFVHLPE